MKNRFSTASETSYAGRLVKAIETGDLIYLADNLSRHIVSYEELAELENLAEQTAHAERVKPLLAHERTKWVSVSDNEDRSFWLPHPEHRAIALDESARSPGSSDKTSPLSPPGP